jgi:ankyrin repeat protein
MNSTENILSFYDAVRNEKVNTVVNLVQSKKVDVNFKFPEHDLKTATHIAASKSNLKLLKTLVEDLHSDLEVTDKYGQVPIEYAATHHNYGAIKYLLTKKPALASKIRDHINKPEVEEFFDAVHANNLSKVRQILEYKIVDVDVPNKSDYKNTALHTACAQENFEMVKLLVDEYDADVNAENISEELPIHLTDDDEITDFLVSRGSDVID